MNYDIIYSESPNGLKTEVNEAIAQGWTPIGSVSVCIYLYDKYENRDSETKIISEDVCFYQAMTQEAF